MANRLIRFVLSLCARVRMLIYNRYFILVYAKMTNSRNISQLLCTYLLLLDNFEEISDINSWKIKSYQRRYRIANYIITSISLKRERSSSS